MAKKTIHISDLSGSEIADGRGATISIKFADARKGSYVLDVTDEKPRSLARKDASRRGEGAAQRARTDLALRQPVFRSRTAKMRQ
jgi:hypothetical protein